MSPVLPQTAPAQAQLILLMRMGQKYPQAVQQLQ